MAQATVDLRDPLTVDEVHWCTAPETATNDELHITM